LTLTPCAANGSGGDERTNPLQRGQLFRMAFDRVRAGVTVPSVSVVLPVHNGEPHISDAIRSVLAQTFSDFELVVCDDGSNDGTSETIERFAQTDSRIRLFRRADKSGVAGAANWAVGNARDELVAIAHADDLSHPDRLARQVALMGEWPDCVLTGAPAESIDWNGREAHPANLWRLARPSVFAPFVHSSVMFRRAAFEAVGGYRLAADYWEDLDLYWRIARQGRILVAVRPLSTYRYSRISIRARDDHLRVERSLEIAYRCAKAIEDGGEPSVSDASLEPRRLHPRVFVACSWSRLWAGDRAVLLPQLLTRGRLRLDQPTIESLGFLIWATLAPKSLRGLLRLVTRVRNGLARKELGETDVVAWNPLQSAPSAVMSE
jgi:glycosyltransferase involved in cell wall biosynthesis